MSLKGGCLPIDTRPRLPVLRTSRGLPSCGRDSSGGTEGAEAVDGAERETEGIAAPTEVALDVEDDDGGNVPRLLHVEGGDGILHLRRRPRLAIAPPEPSIAAPSRR